MVKEKKKSIMEHNIIDKCVVLVSSCDLYEEAWEPFFSLFLKFWPDCPFEIILNTESKKCNIQGVKTYNNKGNWCERLSDTLKMINAPYVIFLLEDFFFQSYVKTNEIIKCINYLSLNINIACFYFKRIANYYSKEVQYEGFMRMTPIDDSNNYFLNCQAAIWNKDVLISLLENTSDPWEFELEGYKNNKAIIDKYEFYCHRTSYHDKIRDEDIFPYSEVLFYKGLGIKQSRWLWNNKKLFKKNGIRYRFKDLKKMSYAEYFFLYDVRQFFTRIKQAIQRRL